MTAAGKWRTNVSAWRDEINRKAVARLDGHGRLIIRASGTEPVIRVMGEGEDKVLIEEIVDGIVAAVTKAAA